MELKPKSLPRECHKVIERTIKPTAALHASLHIPYIQQNLTWVHSCLNNLHMYMTFTMCIYRHKGSLNTNTYACMYAWGITITVMYTARKALSGEFGTAVQLTTKLWRVLVKKSLLHSAPAYNVTSFTEALFKKSLRALQFLLVLFFSSFHLQSQISALVQLRLQKASEGEKVIGN